MTRITRVTEEIGTDAAGRPTPMMRVEFAVDDHGPFIVRMPREGFTAHGARQEMEKLAREVADLTR